MKPVNRYISLLLICGLMLPLYDKHTYYNTGIKNNAQTSREKLQPIKESDCKTKEGSFSFFKDIISNIAPALKNLK
ncbi:MAG: hypothetical protein JO080_01670 [Mucilaginibacter sp.]|nr:hypothetical protein [Mucilaginibacter sp.]